jgi:hypothetical protein
MTKKTPSGALTKKFLFQVAPVAFFHVTDAIADVYRVIRDALKVPKDK